MREYTLDEIMAHPAFAAAFRNELYGPGLEKEAIYGLITKGLSRLPFGSAGKMAREVAADAAKKIKDPMKMKRKAKKVSLTNSPAPQSPNAAAKDSGRAFGNKVPGSPTPAATPPAPPPNNVIQFPGSQASGKAVPPAPEVPGYDPNKLERKAPKPESVLPGGTAPSAKRKGKAVAEKGNAAEVTTPKPETVNVLGMDINKENLPYLAGAGLLGAGALGGTAGYVLGS